MKDQLQAGSLSLSRFFQLNTNQTSLLFGKQATYKSHFLDVCFHGSVIFQHEEKSHLTYLQRLISLLDLYLPLLHFFSGQ